MKYLSHHLYLPLFLISSLNYAMQDDLQHKREVAYRSATRYALTQETAAEIFPAELPLEQQVKFLSLFLYSRVKPYNQQLMLHTFIAAHQFPRKPIEKVQTIRPKTFVNKIGRCLGHDKNQARTLLNALREMYDRIERDENKSGYDPKEIYKEAMKELFPPEKTVRGAQNSEPEYDAVEADKENLE